MKKYLSGGVACCLSATLMTENAGPIEMEALNTKAMMILVIAAAANSQMRRRYGDLAMTKLIGTSNINAEGVSSPGPAAM